MRSSPAPVSTDGLGSGTSVPSGCRSNCMNTRFQISRKRPASAPSTNASVEKSVRSSSVHSPLASSGNRQSSTMCAMSTKISEQGPAGPAACVDQ
jgi:hypothetical protein